jgi:hypothetical protein
MPLAEEMASGTLITFEEEQTMEQAVISGIAFARDEAKITVMNVPDRPGVAYQILGPVAEANVDVDMIIQNASREGRTDVTFTVPEAELQRTLETLGTLALLDQPGTALDAPSVRFLSETFARWAQSRERALLIADYQRPEGLALAHLIDLDRPSSAL